MKTSQITNLFSFAIAMLAVVSTADAQFLPGPPATPLADNYSEDFDDLMSSNTVLIGAGFTVFADNAGAGASFGGAPGEGPQISILENDGMGNQFINFFANYDNADVHQNPALNEAISIFQSRTFTGADAAEAGTYIFKFDFASNEDFPLTGSTTTGAFIRVFDGAFNLLAEETFNTTAATPTFATGQIELTLDPVFEEGGTIQFGFNNLVGRFEGSGIFYDNLSFTLEGALALGDFDADGDVDCDDVDAYVGNIGVAATGSLEQLDLNGDNMVTAADAELHVTTMVETTNGVVGTFLGDLNCDGSVSVLGDAFTLVGNLNSMVSSYTEGDINFDGSVTVLGDAFALVGNLGESNAP